MTEDQTFQSLGLADKGWTHEVADGRSVLKHASGQRVEGSDKDGYAIISGERTIASQMTMAIATRLVMALAAPPAVQKKRTRRGG